MGIIAEHEPTEHETTEHDETSEHVSAEHEPTEHETTKHEPTADDGMLGWKTDKDGLKECVKFVRCAASATPQDIRCRING
eukprot:1758387-Pyramimonas_sp.AAC.1